MKDILGRKLNDCDLVVVKPTGKYSIKQLAIGLWQGNSVRFIGGKKASYMDYFKIVNPTKEELNIKENILNEIKCEKQIELQQKQERMSKKKIPQKDLKIGCIYEDDSKNNWIYLGMCNVDIEDCYKHKEGYTYVCIRDINKPIDNKDFLGFNNISVVKNSKRLIKEVKDVNKELLQFKNENIIFVKNDVRMYRQYNKVNIELKED